MIKEEAILCFLSCYLLRHRQLGHAKNRMTSNQAMKQSQAPKWDSANQTTSWWQLMQWKASHSFSLHFWSEIWKLYDSQSLFFRAYEIWKSKKIVETNCQFWGETTWVLSRLGKEDMAQHFAIFLTLYACNYMIDKHVTCVCAYNQNKTGSSMLSTTCVWHCVPMFVTLHCEASAQQVRTIDVKQIASKRKNS